MTKKPRRDPRIQRTQQVLREALHSLITEKPYEAIVVKEILGRANVGRSTFYAHFRDKDALLAAGIHDLLRGARAAAPRASAPLPDRLVWFSLPIFEHLEHHVAARDHAPQSESQARLHEQLEQVLAGIIADELRQARRGRGAGERGVPPELISRYVAATFIHVLNWWIDGGRSRSAREADSLFRALVVPSLTAIS